VGKPPVAPNLKQCFTLRKAGKFRRFGRLSKLEGPDETTPTGQVIAVLRVGIDAT
jgi:hypothetical protein